LTTAVVGAGLTRPESTIAREPVNDVREACSVIAVGGAAVVVVVVVVVVETVVDDGSANADPGRTPSTSHVSATTPTVTTLPMKPTPAL